MNESSLVPGAQEIPAGGAPGARWQAWLIVGGGVLLVALIATVCYLHLVGVDQGRIDAARAQLKVIGNWLELHRLAHGDWPEQLTDLLDDPAATGSESFRPIDRNALIDPWGHPFGYDPEAPDGPLVFCTTASGLRLTHRIP
jgi:hypothetical protein